MVPRRSKVSYQCTEEYRYSGQKFKLVCMYVDALLFVRAVVDPGRFSKI